MLPCLQVHSWLCMLLITHTALNGLKQMPAGTMAHAQLCGEAQRLGRGVLRAGQKNCPTTTHTTPAADSGPMRALVPWPWQQCCHNCVLSTPSNAQPSVFKTACLTRLVAADSVQHTSTSDANAMMLPCNSFSAKWMMPMRPCQGLVVAPAIVGPSNKHALLSALC